MRLVDADKLIDDFKNELEKVDFEKLSDNDKLIISTSAIALKDFVKRQPIAYNIDKVIEELEELREGMLAGDYCCANLDFCRHVDCDKCEQIIVTDKAIEIVRDGGMKDEV